MGFTPTPEQESAREAFRTGSTVVLDAGAGTGKTSTLKLLAHSAPTRRGFYVAFNKSIAVEAAASFPDTVNCRTLHSVALAAVGTPEIRRRVFEMGRQPGKEAASILGIRGPHRISEERVLAPAQVARSVMDTITRFCHSADDEVGRKHVPPRPGIEDPAAHSTLTTIVLPLARKAWADMNNPHGRLRLTHDAYLKMYALTHPVAPVDYMFLDEAQDSNPVTVGIVKDQAAAGTQIVVVGDPNQAIYGWRGAINAMDDFTGERRSLTQSFRFGPRVAVEANKWLSILHSNLRLKGDPTILSVVGDLDGPTPTGDRAPDAILCRTNATAITTLMKLIDAGVKATVVGGGRDMRTLAECCIQLKEQHWTWHPDLAAFSSWGQIQDYVENDAGGSDLATAVRLIDSWGPEVIIEAIDAMADEKHAEVTISTAHKAKGREWDRVRIAEDFREPKPREDGSPGLVQPEDARLAYVAVTRAQKVLDVGSLEWVDRYVPRPGRNAA